MNDPIIIYKSYDYRILRDSKDFNSYIIEVRSEDALGKWHWALVDRLVIRQGFSRPKLSNNFLGEIFKWIEENRDDC